MLAYEPSSHSNANSRLWYMKHRLAFPAAFSTRQLSTETAVWLLTFFP